MKNLSKTYLSALREAHPALVTTADRASVGDIDVTDLCRDSTAEHDEGLTSGPLTLEELLQLVAERVDRQTEAPSCSSCGKYLFQALPVGEVVLKHGCRC